MSKLLVYSLIIIAFIVGMGAGYSLTPEYASTMQEKNTTMVPLGKADRFIDLRYLNGVIAHHLTAIDLARQALEKSHREEVRNLAEEIIQSDEASIKQLMIYKQSWYKDDRNIGEFEKINLGDDGKRFDLRFLNTLITHHVEAIDTAKEISTKSTRDEVLNLADEITQSLGKSKLILEQLRKDWYAI